MWQVVEASLLSSLIIFDGHKVHTEFVSNVSDTMMSLSQSGKPLIKRSAMVFKRMREISYTEIYIPQGIEHLPGPVEPQLDLKKFSFHRKYILKSFVVVDTIVS